MNDSLRSSIRSLAAVLEPVCRRYVIRCVDSDRSVGASDPDRVDPATTPRLARLLDQAAAIWRFRTDRSTDFPAVVGFLGGTGTGKSTLINALAQADICHTSPIRPNTAGPILYLHERYLEAALSHAELLGFPPRRTDDNEPPPVRGQPDAILVVPHRDERFRSVALLDSPDIDSFEQANREIARRILGWLDGLCIVAIYEKLTQREYADLLAEADRINVDTCLVLNKVDPEEHEVLAQQARQYLTDRGCSEHPLLVPRRIVAQLPEDAGVMTLRKKISDGPSAPRRIETDEARWPANLHATLLAPAGKFLDTALAERDHADALRDELEDLLPDARFDLARFTSDISRTTRRQSWLYHFSFRQLGDHIETVGRQVRGWTFGSRGDDPADHADTPASDADRRAGEYLRTRARNDLEALYLALEDRVLADPWARSLFRNDVSPPPDRIDPALIEAALAQTVSDINALIASARSPEGRGAAKTLHKLARRIGLPVHHLTKLVPYLVLADILFIGGAVTMMQAAGVAVAYEVANIGLTVLTDDVRRESRRIAQRFQDRYRQCLTDQVRLFTDRIDAALASREQLADLRRAVEAVQRRVNPHTPPETAHE